MTPEEMIGRTLREGHTTGATAAGAMKPRFLPSEENFRSKYQYYPRKGKKLLFRSNLHLQRVLSARLPALRMPEMIWTARMALPLLSLSN